MTSHQDFLILVMSEIYQPGDMWHVHEEMMMMMMMTMMMAWNDELITKCLNLIFRSASASGIGKGYWIDKFVTQFHYYSLLLMDLGLRKQTMIFAHHSKHRYWNATARLTKLSTSLPTHLLPSSKPGKWQSQPASFCNRVSDWWKSAGSQ